MKPDEKDDVMKRFKLGEFDVLVATTVVEVGVDVPNAAIMLIEGAERFGLAQLHQLRGRVGRGAYQSYCYLVPSEGKKPSERLYELEKSQDGFHLAEVDLRLRGPGEIYGRMQHGELNLRIANLTDVKLLRRAKSAAGWLLASGADLVQYKQFYKHVSRYRGLTSLN
jgi:ATP-dependent DNA helicase RecG